MALRNVFRLVTKQSLRYYSSSPKLVDVNVNDKTGIATVTMQRPPVNSLNLELLRALLDTLEDLESNRTRGMILTSVSNNKQRTQVIMSFIFQASDTVFSAGLDITEMYKPDLKRAEEFWTTLQETWMKLYGSMFPTAAAINVIHSILSIF